MNSEAGYFRLGLFILIGLGLLVAGVVAFGAASFNKDSFVMETVTLDSVQGLVNGAPVKFRGVEIGRVRKIELAINKYTAEIAGHEAEIGNAVLIQFSIAPNNLPISPNMSREEKLKMAVSQGLRTRLGSSGITGPPFLELVFLTGPQAKEIELPWKPNLPYIPAAEGTFTQIVKAADEIIQSIRKADVGKVITNVDGLVVDVRKAVTDLKIPEVRERAVALIDDLRQSNTQLQAILTSPELQRLLKESADTASAANTAVRSPEVQKFLKDLPEISERLKSTTAQVDKLVHDPKLSETIANLSNTTEGASAAMADLRRLVRSVSSLMASQQGDIESVVRNLRSVMENLADVTEQAKDNPSRLLFGKPPARFDPKEKR
jgi:ABC-type transporter Mla subunit MlaD